MGRKATTNLNLPPHMRKRVRGEHVYFYLDTGSKPRKEIPLGTDYLQALRKYAELTCVTKADNVNLLFGDVIDRYVR